jgi:hypothetical protein
MPRVWYTRWAHDRRSALQPVQLEALQLHRQEQPRRRRPLAQPALRQIPTSNSARSSTNVRQILYCTSKLIKIQNIAGAVPS